MNVLVLEDEPLAAGRLSAYIERYGHGATQVGWAQSIADAEVWLAANDAPDLVLSDIELLDGNVFTLLERVAVAAPIVFATAYDQYLLRAFQTNGVGYLLKPYTYEAFAAALDKVRVLREGPAVAKTDREGPVAAGQIPPATLEALRAALAARQVNYRERLTVKRPAGISILRLADIPLLMSEDKVTFAVDAAGRRHPLTQSLSALEAELDPGKWFRANRRELIHLPFVERMESYGRDRLAVHLRGVRAAVVASRERTPELRRWVG